MRCEEVKQHVAEYLAGRLEPRLATDLAHHVALCEACRSECASFEALWQEMGTPRPPAVPSSVMRERFLAMLATAERRPALSPVRSRTTD